MCARDTFKVRQKIHSTVETMYVLYVVRRKSFRIRSKLEHQSICFEWDDVQSSSSLFSSISFPLRRCLFEKRNCLLFWFFRRWTTNRCVTTSRGWSLNITVRKNTMVNMFLHYADHSFTYYYFFFLYERSENKRCLTTSSKSGPFLPKITTIFNVV